MLWDCSGFHFSPRFLVEPDTFWSSFHFLLLLHIALLFLLIPNDFQHNCSHYGSISLYSIYVTEWNRIGHWNQPTLFLRISEHTERYTLTYTHIISTVIHKFWIFTTYLTYFDIFSQIFSQIFVLSALTKQHGHEEVEDSSSFILWERVRSVSGTVSGFSLYLKILCLCITSISTSFNTTSFYRVNFSWLLCSNLPYSFKSL